MDKSDCIEWTGYRCPKGYGQVKYEGKMEKAHRVAWAKANGKPIPRGRVVRHTCDNPPCVNPAHLKVGTQQDNVDDMISRGRQPSRVGVNNGRGKLTEAQVLAIRESPGTQRAIAKVFGISKSQVHNIRSGAQWSHV